MSLLFAVEMVIVGAGVGVLSAALGLGGGVLMVPAFMMFAEGMDAHTAKGTSLFIIIFVAFFNAWRMTRGWPARPWALAAWFSLASIAGSYAGAGLTALLPDTAVIAIFMALVAFLAVRTLFLQPRIVREDEVRRRIPMTLLIGLIAGVAGGATGTGGGAVLIPLALWAGLVANDRAVGLSNMVMVATSIAGTVAHLQQTPTIEGAWVYGHIDFAMVPLVFLGAQLGSPLGQRLNSHLTLPRRRIAMAVLLSIITVQLGWRLINT